MPRELHRKRGRYASRRADGQCHRKQTAIAGSPALVRVKRWGKSPPRHARAGRHEKPLPVQGKIGGWAARPTATGMLHPPRLMRLVRPGNGGQVRRKAGLREMTTEAPQGAEQNPAYRPRSYFFRSGITGGGKKGSIGEVRSQKSEVRG